MKKERLISQESLTLALERIQKMRKLQNVAEADELFITKVSAKSHQVENLHVKAEVNGNCLENDEPKELGGTGNYINPMEALLASMANCLETSALVYFSFLNLDVTEIQVKVEGTYDKRSVLPGENSPPTGYYEINYHWYITTQEEKHKIKEALKQVERKCPVKATIEHQQEIGKRITFSE